MKWYKVIQLDNEDFTDVCIGAFKTEAEANAFIEECKEPLLRMGAYISENVFTLVPVECKSGVYPAYFSREEITLLRQEPGVQMQCNKYGKVISVRIP